MVSHFIVFSDDGLKEASFTTVKEAQTSQEQLSGQAPLLL